MGVVRQLAFQFRQLAVMVTVVSTLLGHSSITTTLDIYTYLLRMLAAPWRRLAGSPGGRCGCEPGHHPGRAGVLAAPRGC